MSGESGTGGFAVSGDDVDDAVGESGFRDELTETERGERCLLGGLEDDGASGSERGTEFPDGHEQREIPGDDLANYADGFTQRVGVIHGAGRVRDREGNGGTFEFGGPSGHIAEEVDSERNVGGAGNGEGLAVVEGFEGGEFFGVLFEKIGKFPDELAALGGGHAGPWSAVEGAAGGADGGIDVGAIAFGNLREDFSGGGIVGGEGLAGSGVDPLAVDEHFAGGGDEVGDARIDIDRGNGDAHSGLLKTERASEKLLRRSGPER